MLSSRQSSNPHSLAWILQAQEEYQEIFRIVLNVAYCGNLHPLCIEDVHAYLYILLF